MVIAVDRARPRERRNLLLTIFSFSYCVFFVVPVFVFYIGEIGYIQDVGPTPSPIPLMPEDIARGTLGALLGYVMLLTGTSCRSGRSPRRSCRACGASGRPRSRSAWR